MYLARKGVEAYKSELTSVIPVVYAWEPPNDANHGLGWILMDFKPGVGLDEHFASASDEEKATSIEQVANIFTGIQRAPLPSTLSSYGGLTIDEAGEIVSGQMTVLAGGPWNSYATFWKNKLVSQLNGADGSSALRGWKDNGVRERIDRLLATDLDNFLAEAGVETTKRSLVHGDLSTFPSRCVYAALSSNLFRSTALNNILYDVASKRVTGLVDFDFASISHPSQEFFMSLWDLGGNLGACHGPDPTNGRLTEALITGDFEQSTVPESATSLWATAKTWDSALKARGSVRPSQIAGIAALDQLRRLEATLCPFRLAHPMFLKRKTPEQIVEEREAAEKTLVACLESLGF